VFRRTCGPPCAFCARLRVSWAPGFPCALCFSRGHRRSHNFGRYPRREIAMSYPAAGRIYRKQRYAYRSTGITLRNPAALAGSIGNDENRYPAREARKISGELSSGQVSPKAATTSGGSVFRFEPVPAVTRAAAAPVHSCDRTDVPAAGPPQNSRKTHLKQEKKAPFCGASTGLN
jgi:hypothetical protein